MIKLDIKTASLPQRCEICHQNDCFSPATNFCSRCSSAITELPNNFETAIAIETRALQMIYYISISFGLIFGFMVWQVINSGCQTLANNLSTFKEGFISIISLIIGGGIGGSLYKGIIRLGFSKIGRD